MVDIAEIVASLNSAGKKAAEEELSAIESGDPQAAPSMTETHFPESSRWSELLEGRNIGRILLLSGGVAIHAIYIYIVATILPQIVGDIGGVEYFAWSTTLFMVGSIAGSAGAAALESRSGPAISYRWAACLFAGGSLLCALAPAMPVLVAGRLLQGLGGGLLTAVAYATIRQIFEPRLHAKAISLVSGVWGVSGLVGPLVGGVFAASSHWRGAFGSAVPLCAIFAIATQKMLPARGAPDAEDEAVPFRRLALLAVAALAISAGSVSGRMVEAIAGILTSIALTGLLLRLENRNGQRLFPKGIGRPRTELGVISLTMLVLTTGSSAMAFLPFFLIKIFNVSALEAGYIVALEAMGWALTALLTSSVNPRHTRRLMLLSPVSMCLAAGVLIASLHAGTVLGIGIAMALTGISMGLGWAHYANRLIELAQHNERPQAATFISTGYLIGTAFGAALAGMVVNLAGLPHAATAVKMQHVAVILFAVFSASPFLAATVCVLSGRFRKRRDQADAEA